MNEIISIIVPVYNVFPYLRKCIDSLLNQTYPDVQIILVDDGSTDGSSDICDCYASKHSNIVVIHKNNSGLSEARNVGLEAATGTWIAFIDSDDWIEPTFCEVLYQAAISHSAEISMCKTRLVKDNNAIVYEEQDTGTVIEMSYPDVIEGLLNQKHVRFEVWHKLWNRELIGDVRFISGQVSEDVHFDRLCFPKANKLVFVDETLHNYLIKRPGNTNSKYRRNRDCVFNEFDLWASELESNNYKSSAEIILFLAMRFSIIMFTDAFFTHQNKAEINRLKSIFDYYYSLLNGSKYINNSIKLFHRFPYIYALLLCLKRKIK